MGYAIKVTNVTKTYNLGERSGTRLLSEAVTRRRQGETKATSTFRALSDVSFEIENGRAVGIVGRNGAGKTTILKLISRITRPTSGEIRIRGRVGSLLEVGTGFHPELTGRENVFMNGSMLGMRRQEILRKFDDIVAFADVHRFIDTPVKRYSSGMYVRLAFAVAAHLEPEILVVDEVLAVGDSAFQQKCLGKMGEVAREGRTVLFVSHNIAAVRQLTEHSVLLDRGQVVAVGATEDVLSRYSEIVNAHHGEDLASATRWDPTSLREVELLRARADSRTGVFLSGEDPRFEVEVRSSAASQRFQLFLAIYDLEGAAVGASWSEPLSARSQHPTTILRVVVPGVRLAPGRYRIALGTGLGYGQRGHRDFDGVLGVCDFEVASPVTPDGTLGYWAPSWGRTIYDPVDVSIEVSPREVEQYLERSRGDGDE